MFAVHINDPILPYPGSRHCSPSPPRAVWFRKRLIMRHEKGARQEWLTRVLLPSCSMLAWLGHKQVLNKSYLQGRFLSVNLCCSSSPSYHSSSSFYSIYVVLVSSFSFWRTLLHTHTHILVNITSRLPNSICSSYLLSSSYSSSSNHSCSSSSSFVSSSSLINA